MEKARLAVLEAEPQRQDELKHYYEQSKITGSSAPFEPRIIIDYSCLSSGNLAATTLPQFHSEKEALKQHLSVMKKIDLNEIERMSDEEINELGKKVVHHYNALIGLMANDHVSFDVDKIHAPNNCSQDFIVTKK